MNSTFRMTCLAVSLVAVANTQASAQGHATDRGSVQLSGAASVTSSGIEGGGARTTSISFNPRAAYFIAKNFAVGADVFLQYQSRSGNSMRGFGIGPAATYYIGEADATMLPYITANLQWNRSTASGAIADSKITTTGAGAGIGLLFLLSPSVGITSELFIGPTA